MESMLIWILPALIVLVFWASLCGPAVACALIARSKNRNPYRWYFLGLVGHWIALVVAAVLPTVDADKNRKLNASIRPIWVLIASSLVIVIIAFVIQQTVLSSR